MTKKNGTDYANLTLAQLRAMAINIENQIAIKQSEEADAIRDKAAKLASAAGYDIRQLFGAPSRKKRKTNKTLHVNPHNPKQTWSGMGRKPKWFREAQK